MADNLIKRIRTDKGDCKIDYNSLANRPSSMKNPYALTFSGAASSSYDGTVPVNVRIPPIPTWADQDTNPSYTKSESDEKYATKQESDEKFAPISAAIRPTVTGNPAVCENSAEWRLQGLKIYGKSTQDGEPSPENPVSIVSAGDGGSVETEVTGGNLIRTHGSETINGVTFTDNRDGTITVNGTASSDAIYYLTSRDGPFGFNRKNTIYFLSGCPSGASSSKYRIQWWNYDGLNNFAYDYGDGIAVDCLDVTANYNICINVKSGNTLNNIVFKPMLNYGTKAMPFEPYKGLQKIAISTPNGLPGIPVESGGNFTDADGQQLVCNFIDLSDGKKHYPVKKYLAEELSFLVNASWTQANPDYAFAYSPLFGSKPIGRAISNTLKSIKLTSHLAINEPIVMVETSSNYSVLYVAVLKSNLSQVSPVGIKSYLTSISAEFIAANTNPDETEEISAEELAAYRALTTYDGATVISTAEPVAGIEATYVMDGNKYRESVDKRLAALEAAQTGI